MMVAILCMCARDPGRSLRWALQHGISPGAAHRQLARVAAAAGDTANADLAYSNALQAGDMSALPDHAHVFSSDSGGSGGRE